uniref:Uncharacterized protein n=1 Tax=Glossina austeni TaxID=7395 RepID=A0A1A9V0V6_GLOAU
MKVKENSPQILVFQFLILTILDPFHYQSALFLNRPAVRAKAKENGKPVIISFVTTSTSITTTSTNTIKTLHCSTSFKTTANRSLKDSFLGFFMDRFENSKEEGNNSKMKYE